MAPSTFSFEIECKVPAKRMWRATYECAPQCLPKALPNLIQAAHYSSPTLSPGCIGTLVFTEDHAKHLKEKLQAEVALTKDRFEEVDPRAFKVKCVVIEGGFLVGFFKSYRHTVQFKETGAESCVVHYSAEYEPIHDEHKHQFPEDVKDALVRTFKAVEAYLLSHNDFQ